MSSNRYYLVKVDQSIGGYDPVETIHLIVTDQDILDECIELLTGLWIDPYKVVYKNVASFFDGEVTCEISRIKEIDEQTFDLLKGIGL